MRTHAPPLHVAPQDLKHTMAGLLRLHMVLSNEAHGDEQVGQSLCDRED